MMAFGRKRRKIEQLQRRIDDLEERLCPCASHDWKRIGTKFYSVGGMIDAEYKYKCKRCGKETWDWR